jgi:hypothetical protein
VTVRTRGLFLSFARLTLERGNSLSRRLKSPSADDGLSSARSALPIM